MPPNPARPPALLGIDLGTSSAKAVVVDLEGGLLAQASVGYPVDNPRPGWAETEPARWWAAVVTAVRRAVAAAKAEPAAIGLSGQMHGLVVCSSDGTPVRPAMLWPDARAVDELATYRQLPAAVRGHLGNPLTPGMAGPMLAWLAKHERDSYLATRWALQPKDWLRMRLTGQAHSEPSDASATLLYDISTDAWDVDVLSALGLDPRLLAPLLSSSGQRAGDLLPEAARELGLAVGIPVAAGAADTAAAALGSGLVNPMTAQLTIGTGAQVVTPVGTLTPRGPAPVTHLYRAATDAGWYAMAAVVNAGLALDWVRQLLGASWEELYGAAAAPPAADDPMFLPHLNGERTPYLDPTMRGAWTGLSPRHDRQRLLRAALEGVALAIRDALDDLLPAGSQVDHLRLAGGGSTAPEWRQMLADTLGYTLRAVDIPAASGRGAAFLGARAAGFLDEAAMLARLVPGTELVATARTAQSEHYAERLDRFRRSIEALRQVSAQQAPRTRRRAPTARALGYDRKDVTVGMVHIGVGGFHRAHQAMFLDRLMNDGKALEWGICGVGILAGDAQMRQVMRAQDCLYTLVVKPAHDPAEARVVGSIVEYLFAPDDPEAVIEKMADARTHIVSLTVTEGGYNLDDVTGEFDAENPGIQHDLRADATPRTMFGLVTESLARRRQRNLRPFTIMSCDNIPGNGTVARRMFVAFARLKDPALGSWVEREVHFPSSMVDRITPATTDGDRAEVSRRFGIEDRWPVVCEPFSQWVLEDDFGDGRPPLEDVGVQLVTDVAPYELMKLRLLNASHQVMSYLGYLAGYRYIHEVCQDELFRDFLLGYLDQEATPTLLAVPGIDLDEYKHTLISRFANPQIRDTVARNCADSSDRIPKFLLPVIRHQLATGGEVSRSIAAIAGWARYAEGIDEHGRPIQVVDRMRDQLMARARRQRLEPTAFVADRGVFGDLVDDERFVSGYVATLASLYERGARRTVEEIVLRKPMERARA